MTASCIVGVLTGGTVTVPEENGQVEVCVSLPNGVSSSENVIVTFMPQVKQESVIPATRKFTIDTLCNLSGA